MRLPSVIPAVVLRALAASVVSAFVTGGVVGCGAGAGSEDAAPRPASLRIASLSPALTSAVVALGGGASIVGRTPWCTGIAPAVPVVGSLEDCDLERVLAVHAGLVLVQGREVPGGLARAARENGFDVRAWHLDSVADVLGAVDALGALLEDRGVPGARAAAGAIERTHREALATELPERGPVLLLFALDPPMAFGRGTYVDGLWCGMGGRNAVESPGYPSLTAEDVVRLAPARTIVVGTTAPPAWLLRATRGPVVRIDAPFLLEPSARMLVDGPAVLRHAAEAGGVP